MPAARVSDLLARTEHTLPLSERYGPTLQGEGPAAGRPAWFIRLGGCDLSCRWCDSAYTWDGKRYDLRQEITATRVHDITDPIPSGVLVILTGGEPLLHQDRAAWDTLLTDLAARGCAVHVETNGTRLPNDTSTAGVATFVVSPKLDNAGTHRGRQDPTMHHGWRDLAATVPAHLKVVCADAADVATAVELAGCYHWPLERVWVMPLGASTTDLARTWPPVAAAAAYYGINATHRLHVLAWGDERGH